MSRGSQVDSFNQLNLIVMQLLNQQLIYGQLKMCLSTNYKWIKLSNSLPDIFEFIFAFSLIVKSPQNI